MVKIPWKKLNNYEPVEAGVYEVLVVKHEHGTSHNNNPKIVWTYEIVGPEGENVGRKIIDSHTLTDKAVWRLGWFVSSLNVDIDKLPDMSSGTEEFNKVLNACHGRKCWITVIVDTYDGKPNNKVTDYAKSEDQSELAEIDIDDIPAFVKNKVTGKIDEQVPF